MNPAAIRSSVGSGLPSTEPFDDGVSSEMVLLVVAAEVAYRLDRTAGDLDCGSNFIPRNLTTFALDAPVTKSAHIGMSQALEYPASPEAETAEWQV